MDKNNSNNNEINTNIDNMYKVVFIIGAPGAGKNTLCDLIVSNYNNLKHFGAGDLLREETKKESDIGKEIASIINKGNIVPVKITLSLIKAKMDALIKSNPNKDMIFLIDGYPRNEDNITGWKEYFDKSNDKSCKILGVINLNCSVETCYKRLCNRGLSSGRKDDDKEVIKRRFEVFEKESKIVVDLMKSSTEILTISSDNSPEEVYKSVVEFLNIVTK